MDKDDPKRAEAERPDSAFFGNITEWGQQAKSFMTSEDGLEAEGRWSSVSLVEHHLCAKNVQKLRGAMDLSGYKTCVVPASKTGRSEGGTHGGVSVSVKKNIAATVVDPAAKHQGDHTLWGDGWATTVQHRKGLDVAVTCAYFECGSSKLSEANARRAREIKACHAALGIPWILAADFNATPAEIAASGLQAIIGGQVMTPAGVTHTCTSGQKRMLDYWLVDPRARPYVCNERAVVVPWKPHFGIAHDWVADASEVKGMTHETARAVLSPVNLRCDLDKLSRSSNEQWHEAGWLAHTGESAYRGATWKQDCGNAHVGDNQDAEWRSGLAYARWGAQMAGCLAIGNGIEPGRDVRCTVRVPKQRPLYKARKAKERPGHILPADAIGFAWAGAEVSLRTILHFYGTNRGEAQRASAVKWLQDRIVGRLKTLWLPKRVKEWVPGKKPRRVAKGQTTTTPSPVTKGNGKGRGNGHESSSDDEGGDTHAGHTTWREVDPSAQELAKWRLLLKHPDAANNSDWTTLVVEASRMAAVAKRKARAQARRDAVAWAKECLEGSASKAHGFVKSKAKVLDLMDLASEVDEHGKLQRITCPNVAVERQGKSWHDLWGRDHGARKSLMARLNALRLACRDDDDDEEVDTQQVKMAIKKLNAKAVSGLDVVTARELAALPDDALDELAGILSLINKSVAWPRQSMHHQIVLLGKPRGGQRPICLVAIIIKLWEAVHSETIMSWEEDRVGFWDDAVRGSSALRAAALRRLIAEVAGEHQEAFLYILWDAEKFYDNVDLGILLEAALRLGLPRRQMVLCVDILLAPREIRIGKVVGTAHEPSNGLLAGLRRANFMARLLLYSAIEAIHNAVPRAGPRSYVDDLTQLVTGRRNEVADESVRGAWLLLLALKQFKVKVSEKTVIVGSDIRLAREVATRLAARSGVTLESATHAVDLGIDCGGTRRRMVKTTEREANADAKLAKITFLGSLHRTADKLVKSG